MKTKTSPVTNPMNSAPCRLAFLLLPLVLTLACFAFSPPARAVCQEGCLTNNNTVLGDDALLNNTGSFNTAIGANALISNTTGSLNTALGEEALVSNTTGTENVAIGDASMFKNTQGIRNTATGHNALSNYTSGSFNTAFGYQALLGGDNGTGTGSNNTAVGYWALIGNQSGSNNTATGYQALFGSPDEFSDCSNNTADGANALFSNTTGSNNTADGFQALLNNTTGSFNIAVGNGAGGNLTTGINNIDIGNNGVAGESKTIRIGKSGKQTNTFIAGISGATVPTGVAVIVDASGHLGTTTSSARFKEAIKPMDKASEAILALKPVTFQYKKELDPAGVPQFGLVAENVEKVNPDLVARDDQGKAYTVRYEAVNAMLLNEFLKEHRKVEQQEQKLEQEETTIAQLKSAVAKQEAIIAKQQKGFESKIALQQKQIETLTAGLQRVSAQVEMSRPSPRTVANSQ